MPSFLARVSKMYREGSSYHNFQHALDVLQATYFYLQVEGCVPNILRLLDTKQLSSVDFGRSSPSIELWARPQISLLQRALRNEDLFALYIAAIGHDIGHPGVSNAFLVSDEFFPLYMNSAFIAEECEDATCRTFQ
jgi:hypothetical protein